MQDPDPPLGDLADLASELSRPVDETQYYLWGNEFRRRGEPARAEQALRGALSLAPHLFEARLSLAFLYREQGRDAEADGLFNEWLDLGPEDPLLLTRAAAFVTELHAPETALRCLDRALALNPTFASGWFERGRLLLQSGRFDAAAENLNRALELDPNLDAAYLPLAHAHRFEPSDPLIDFFTRAARQPGQTDSTRACLNFALGKIHDDLGEWDRALAHIETANALRRPTVPFDPESPRRELQRLLSAPPAIWAIPHPPIPPAAVEPLFIVGLPRSGTALVEHLLLKHPAIRSAGELHTLPQLVQNSHLIERRLAQLGNESAAAEPDPDSAAIADLYREELTRGIQPGGRYIIDKNPLNFWHVGAIRHLFPHAPILALERDPRDVLLSLYFHDFAHPALAFSYSIENLLSYFQCYESLMPAWKTLAGRAMRSVRYETVVAEPIKVVHELLRWLGLQPPEAVDPPAFAQDLLKTASAWQAQQPIYGHSVGRWRCYAPTLLKNHPALQTLNFT
ncbi:MAG: tetratricopeptide repeat-containing sulfotransferase family protein [Gammaproteobacteria bacterium]